MPQPDPLTTPFEPTGRPSAQVLVHPDAQVQPATQGCAAVCSGYSRRSVIRGAGSVTLGAAVALLAACAPSTSSSQPAVSGVAAAGSGSTGGAGAGGGAALAKLADVPVGGAVVVKGADGKPIVLAQPVAGTVVGLSAICTHAGCTVAPQGAQLVCPCHGSIYKTADGSNVSGPAPSPLPAVSVRVENGAIFAA